MSTNVSDQLLGLPENNRAAKPAPARSEPRPKLAFTRRFTRDGVDPFDEVEWDLRSAVIAKESGEVVFEQRDIDVPRGWSQMATNVVSSKYFRGVLGSSQRENGVRQLI